MLTAALWTVALGPYLIIPINLLMTRNMIMTRNLMITRKVMMTRTVMMTTQMDGDGDAFLSTARYHPLRASFSATLTIQIFGQHFRVNCPKS